MCLFRWKAWGSPVLPHCDSPNSSKWTFGSDSFSTDWPWILFATMALGMGFDSPWVGRILIRSFFIFSQESGRDGKPSTSKLYFNNNNIGANIKEMQPLWQIGVNTPESCTAFSLTTFVWAFVREMQLLWKLLSEMLLIMCWAVSSCFSPWRYLHHW